MLPFKIFSMCISPPNTHVHAFISWSSLFRGSMKPEACFIIPVNIEEPDPHFPPYQTCMNFVRHTGAPPLGCKSGEFYQNNCVSFQITVGSEKVTDHWQWFLKYHLSNLPKKTNSFQKAHWNQKIKILLLFLSP